MPPPDIQARPHILIFVYSLSRGGAERMTVELARAWAESGCKVTVLTAGPAETDFFQLDARIQRIRLTPLSTPEDGVVRRLVAALRRLFTLRRILRGLRPNVALGMMSTAATLLAFSSIGLKIRTFGSERTYPPMLPLGLAKEKMRWLSYGLLTGVMGQTEQACRWLRANTLARRTWAIPNHIELPLPAHPPHIEPDGILSPGRRCILAVGRLSEEKQFQKQMDAFAILAERFPEWDLVIVGDGPDREELAAHARLKGLEERVHMPGAVGDIGVWYAKADIFVMTSRFEGFPNALLEAMAHGVPPIAFDCATGPSEMIRDGANGLLISMNDQEGLVEGMKTLMKDDALRESMGQEAVLLREQFSKARVMALWFRAFGYDEGAKGELSLG
ncbi:MAG TPA: glycosyltransferase family 4 protein [Caulobacteraceae bacterium]|nr:glycosyltransferase family 4 protein [Caulobacteraceae bacterium]